MPIAALPSSAVQAIGSALVITDACSVVKELLDNALDAAASSIHVEISKNTVDVIQVKDNGHGISPDDHPLVCKRNFTSKIQTLEDLRDLGGQCLGFRGEALASACEMVGSLSISTKTETQAVGSKLTYSRTGDLISSERVPHPVGTTIRITDFLKYVPVRRQTVLKDATKTVAKLKKLLQTYAIAKPSTRLSFRVLQGRSESANWTYGPKKSANLSDAALIVAGADIAIQCIYENWSPAGLEEDGRVRLNTGDERYKMMAFLPKAGADFSKIASFGQFFSVDGRPVSASKGLFKEITKMFKSCLRSVAKSKGINSPLSDPFLCIHLQCPLGSYDANIEPAKDDVLFTDPKTVLSLAAGLFKRVYSKPDDGISDDHAVSLQQSRNKESNLSSGFEAGKIIREMTPTSPQVAMTSLGTSKPSRITHSQLSDSERVVEDEITVSPINSSSVNPWVIAKMNVSLRANNCNTNRTGTSKLATPAREPRSCQPCSPSESGSRRHPSRFPLPSPSNSGTSLSPRESSNSPLFLSSSHHNKEDDLVRTFDISAKSARGFQKTSQPFRNRVSTNGAQAMQVRGHNSLQQSQSSDPSEMTQSNFQGSVETLSDATRIIKPARQVRTSRDLEYIGGKKRRQELPVLEKWSRLLHEQASSSPVDEALDFERRKRAAILSRRGLIKHRQEAGLQSTTDSSSNSPHTSRYLAARGALSSGVGNSEATTSNHGSQPPAASGLDYNDSRAYFLRHRGMSPQDQSSKPGPKISRIQSCKFPLEQIDEGLELHDLALGLSVSLDIVAECFRRTREVDMYVHSGSFFDAFAASDLEGTSKIWETRLVAIIQEKYKKQGSDEAPLMRFDIYAAIKSQSDGITAA
ncbi:hypothetical protein V8E54_001214 [Elaphomyces granulatus]